MPENRLEILLTLEDEATVKLNQAAANVKTQTQEIKKSSEEASKSITNGFKEANRSLRDFRQALLVAGIAVAGIIATTKDWAKTNEKTKDAYDNLEKALKGISASIGSIFAPAIVALSDLVVQSTGFLTDLFNTLRDGYSKLFETISFGIQFNVAFFTSIKEGTGIVNAYKDAMQIATQATAEMREKFDKSLGTGEDNDIMNLGKITILAEKTKQATKTMKDHWNDVKNAVIDFGAALSGASQLSKGFAKAAAVVAMGMAIVNTAQGITSALSGPPNGPPWPLNLALASLIAATGAIQIATIASTNFAQGTDTVPANLSPGEMVFPSSMASAIRRGDITVGGPGGAGGNTINIFIEKAEMTSNQAIEQVAEMLGFSIERSLRLGRGI